MPADTGKTGADHDSSRPSTATRVTVDLDVLDRERSLRGWSKQALAKAAGVTPPTISDLYTNGRTSPLVFAKITAAFDANPPSEVAVRLMGDGVKGAA